MEGREGGTSGEEGRTRGEVRGEERGESGSKEEREGDSVLVVGG